MMKKLAASVLRGASDAAAGWKVLTSYATGRTLEEEYEPEPFTIAYTFLAIITALIAVTIVFETIKDSMVEGSDKYTR
jgi:ABC-type sulfate transport system permease component